MIKLLITEEIQIKHKEYILDTNIRKRLTNIKKGIRSGTPLSEDRKNFVNYLIEQVDLLNTESWKKSIFVCDIGGIKKAIKKVKKEYPDLYKVFHDEEKNKFSTQIYVAIGYDNFRDRNPKFIEGGKRSASSIKGDEIFTNWCAYSFTKALGVTVCPYCNRAYVNTYYTSKGKTRPDLDHFLPKSKYPYLSLSIYNLIPSCKVCNSSLKGQVDFNFKDNINPYESAMKDGLMKFSYKPKDYSDIVGLDEKTLEIKLSFDKKLKDSKRLKKNCETFEIEGLYRNHVNVVKDMLYKEHIFNEDYRKALLCNYAGLFHTMEDLEELLFGVPNSEDVKNVMLGKLKRNIYDEIREDKLKLGIKNKMENIFCE